MIAHQPSVDIYVEDRAYTEGLISTTSWNSIRLVSGTSEKVGLLVPPAYIMFDDNAEECVSHEDFAPGEFDDWRAGSRFTAARRIPPDPANPCLPLSEVIADAALMPVARSVTPSSSKQMNNRTRNELTHATSIQQSRRP